MILFESANTLLLVTNGTTTTLLNNGRNANMPPNIARNTDASDTPEVGAPVTAALDQDDNCITNAENSEFTENDNFSKLSIHGRADKEITIDLSEATNVINIHVIGLCTCILGIRHKSCLLII